MPSTNLTDAALWSLRQRAAESGDVDTSRLCSQALWGDTHQARSGARRALARRAS